MPMEERRQENDLIGEIIADLAESCEEAFARPPSNYRKSTDTFSSRSLRQEDLDRIRPHGSSMVSRATLELNDMESTTRGRPRSVISEGDDFVPEIQVPESYRTSKRSSFSHPSTAQRDGITDSEISLIKSKDKRISAKSHLGQGRSANEQLANSAQDNVEHHDEINQPHTYPSAAKTAVILVSLYISIFLVALDRTIIGPAIPAITNQFNSISDIGWYGSSYMLTSAGFILLYGRIYTFFPTKNVFLSGIFLFEAGSAVCGAAQTSTMLIIGRAIAGLGSSGIFTGAILIMLNTVPLHRRPLLQGLFGACFGVASVAGPLLGGAFTGSRLTWRWCFYINLPLGGLTILVVVFLLKLEEKKPKLANWKDTVKNLDPLGTVLFLPAITCLLLALEWGAADYAWSSPRLVALLIVFAVLFVAFVAWQYYTRNTTATVPARILFQRSVAFGGASQFCVGSTMLTMSIYIPLWFQAIQEVSAMQSGINTIPLVLSVVVGSIMSGGLTQKIGYYTPFMIVGSSLMAVGTGLVTTWDMHTSASRWIGYQVILGYGVGCTMQHPNLAIQIVLARQDVPTGTAILSLCQTLGGAVFAAVGQNLYIDKFSAGLERIGGLDGKHLLEGGATKLSNKVPAALRLSVLAAYNNSLTKGTFFAALIVACLAVPAALGMEWRSVKQKETAGTSAAEDEEKMQPVDKRTAPEGLSARPSTSSRRLDVEEAVLAPLPPARVKVSRQGGHFWSHFTAKVNPDLRAELQASKEGPRA
jgi:EmrB/QacA subfamily drug resistance transporter